jgi:CheY-like chemotaxis protein
MKTLKTIFLVEDDHDDQEIFITALNGIKDVILFDVATNGKEALSRLRQSIILPSLIVMDINMPVMDGMECLKEIAKDSKINDIPIVILSSSIDLREIVYALGARGFIKKTGNELLLRDKLRQTFNVCFDYPVNNV